LRHFLLVIIKVSDLIQEQVTRTHKKYQVTATTPMRKMKPPAAPPAMGPMLLDFELCEPATEVTTEGGGVEVDVIV
jgi:hypothetical protein